MDASDICDALKTQFTSMTFDGLTGDSMTWDASGAVSNTFFSFAAIVYGSSVKFLGKASPAKFVKACLPAALNAFGTCSSSATIPLSKQCMEDEMGVSDKITSIAIPLAQRSTWMLFPSCCRS